VRAITKQLDKIKRSSLAPPEASSNLAISLAASASQIRVILNQVVETCF